MPREFFILVKRHGTNEVLESKGPYSEGRVERIERGMNINLDHERFYTTVEEAKDG